MKNLNISGLATGLALALGAGASLSEPTEQFRAAIAETVENAVLGGKAHADPGVWETGQNIDEALGTEYNQQGPVLAFAGVPGGMSYITSYEAGEYVVLKTTNGIDFENVTNSILALHKDIGDRIFITGYAPDQDSAVLYSSGDSYVIKNFSAGIENWVLVKTEERSGGYGSIEPKTGDVIITKGFNGGDDDGIYNLTTGETLYNAPGHQIDGFFDREKGLIFYADIAAGCVTTVRDYYTGEEFAIGGLNSRPTQLSKGDSEVSISGKDELIFSNGEFEIMVTSEVEPTKIPVDTDGDGVPDSEDACPDDPSDQCGEEEIPTAEEGKEYQEGQVFKAPETGALVTVVTGTVIIVGEVIVLTAPGTSVDFEAGGVALSTPSNGVSSVSTQARGGLTLGVDAAAVADAPPPPSSMECEAPACNVKNLDEATFLKIEAGSATYTLANGHTDTFQGPGEIALAYIEPDNTPTGQDSSTPEAEKPDPQDPDGLGCESSGRFGKYSPIEPVILVGFAAAIAMARRKEEENNKQ